MGMRSVAESFLWHFGHSDRPKKMPFLFFFILSIMTLKKLPMLAPSTKTIQMVMMNILILLN
jgi:hypothetical protein